MEDFRFLATYNELLEALALSLTPPSAEELSASAQDASTHEASVHKAAAKLVDCLRDAPLGAWPPLLRAALSLLGSAAHKADISSTPVFPPGGAALLLARLEALMRSHRAAQLPLGCDEGALRLALARDLARTFALASPASGSTVRWSGDEDMRGGLAVKSRTPHSHSRGIFALSASELLEPHFS